MRAIRPFLLALAVASAPALADTPTDPAPTKVDPNPTNAEMVVLEDAEGGQYVVVDPFLHGKDIRATYFGKKGKLYRQVPAGNSKDEERQMWNAGVWAPRIKNYGSAALQRDEDGTYRRYCSGDSDAVLTEITGEKRAKFLKSAVFYTEYFTRRAHLLGRDDTGTYYFVDQLRSDLGGESYRLYVGKKGGLKLQPLTDTSADTRGELYIAKTGSLSATRTEHQREDSPMVDVTFELAWVRGERRTPLVWLDLRNGKNDRVAYQELGLYGGLGLVCDDL